MRRIFEAHGERWAASPSGRTTQYEKDEFSVRFSRLPPSPPEERVARYSPLLAKDRETSLAQLTDQELVELLRFSQPSWTSAELGYRR